MKSSSVRDIVQLSDRQQAGQLLFELAESIERWMETPMEPKWFGQITLDTEFYTYPNSIGDRFKRATSEYWFKAKSYLLVANQGDTARAIQEQLDSLIHFLDELGDRLGVYYFDIKLPGLREIIPRDAVLEHMTFDLEPTSSLTSMLNAVSMILRSSESDAEVAEADKDDNDTFQHVSANNPGRAVSAKSQEFANATDPVPDRYFKDYRLVGNAAELAKAITTNGNARKADLLRKHLGEVFVRQLGRLGTRSFEAFFRSCSSIQFDKAKERLEKARSAAPRSKVTASNDT